MLSLGIGVGSTPMSYCLLWGFIDGFLEEGEFMMKGSILDADGTGVLTCRNLALKMNWVIFGEMN